MAFEPIPLLGPPGKLEVIVREENGNPIARARVAVFGPPGARTVPIASTDAGGRVDFDGLSSGYAYDVHAHIASTNEWGEDLHGRRIEVHPGKTTEITIERPALRIVGDVREGVASEPIAAAKVEAFAAAREFTVDPDWEAPAPPLASTLSDERGIFHLDTGSSSAVRVRAHTSDGRVGYGLVGRSALGASVHLVVREPKRCTGIVVDAEGRPRPHIVVSLPAANVGSESSRSTTTDSEGRFSLRVFAGGRSARCMVEGDGFPRFLTRIPLDREARVIVPGSSVLEVRVVESGTGRPVAEARLRASIGSRTSEVTTDTDGRAHLATTDGLISLRVLIPGLPETFLEGNREGWASTEPAGALDRPLAEGETRSVTVRVRRGATVVGRVLNAEGVAVGNVSVAIVTGRTGLSPSGRSSTDGRFEIQGVLASPRGWAQGIVVRGDAGVEGVFKESVPMGDSSPSPRTIDLGDFTLRRGAVVRAKVTDSGGQPIPSAGSSGHLAGFANEDGWLSMPVHPQILAPNDTLTFDVSAPDFLTREVRCSGVLGAGEVRDLPPIRLERGPRVAVRVLDASGSPLAGCTVRWTWNGDTTPVRTDAEGRATLSGAPSMDEDIEVSLPDGTRFTRYEELPRTMGVKIDMELKLPLTRTLEVRVVDSAGVPAPAASVWIPHSRHPMTFLFAGERSASADATGLVRLANVIASSLRLRAQAPGFVTQELDIDGSTTSATFTLEAIGLASARRLEEVRALLEKLDREIEAQDSKDESDEARARFRRRRDLQAESERLQGQ